MGGSYHMSHTDLNDGWNVQTTIPIQEGKTYTIIYFVMEKVGRGRIPKVPSVEGCVDPHLSSVPS